LKTLAQALQQKVPIKDLPPFAQDVLHDLINGQMPETESLERLAIEERDRLGKALAGQLRRLVKKQSYSHTDFIAGLMLAAIDLLIENRDRLTRGAKLHISFPESEKVEHDPEALSAFRVLYGGIEVVFSSLVWDLDNLWRLEKEEREVPVEEPGEAEPERIQTASLNFRLSLRDAAGQELTEADLAWQYPPDSPAAATFRAFKKLEDEHRRRGGPLIPVFNAGRPEDAIDDLDLRHPVRTLGAWLDSPESLRQMVRDALNRPAIRREVASAVDTELELLEARWAGLVSNALDEGLLTADVSGMLDSYEKVLQTATAHLRSAQEATYGFRALARAWIVGPRYFDDWAIVPLLHPLKLLWWRNRALQFNGLIAKLFSPDQPSDLVDSVRFRRGLTQTYGSAGFPAVIMLPDQTGQPVTFLPLDEVEGYELFRPEHKAGAAQGLDADLVSPEEAEEEAAKAAESLANVIADYIETYPFVRDGIEVYLLGCRNGALPGQLVEQLSKYLQRRREGTHVRISVVVHTPDRGAPLFGRVNEWVEAHDEFVERPLDDYFPPVTLRVWECSYEALQAQLRPPTQEPNPLARDIVVLPDVLSERGQAVQGRLTPQSETDMPREEFVPFSPLYRSLPMPFEKGELARQALLTPVPMPSVARHFYNSQWAAREGQGLAQEQMAEFNLRYSLTYWSQLLQNLHHTFNWVLCYDSVIDRFLLEDTLSDHVQVIRYSLGLGVKGRHNLTVSSSYWARQVVVRRLTGRLRDLIPAATERLRQQIAERLVDEAKAISGDIVLRAAGPGAYLNELIGLVLAKHLTEREYSKQHPGALKAWLYLDDFGHWFSGRKPDLLFLAIPEQANGELPLHVEVIEAKCIGDTSFGDEAADAERQVQGGVNRLGLCWAPGRQYLDAGYWYDQLYRALVGNLAIQHEQMRLWEALRRHLPKGEFTLEMSGHSWVFCYNGPGTTTNLQPVRNEPSALAADDVPEASLLRHHYGQQGLVKELRSLVDTWEIPSSPENWQAPEPPTAPPPTDSGPAPHLVVVRPVAGEEQGEAAPGAESSVAEPTPIPDWLLEQAHQLDRVLRQYHVNAFPIEPEIVDIGPSIVRYKVRLRPGEHDARLKKIASDLARELALHDTPLIERLPGTQYMAVDIPRTERESVLLMPALAALPPAAVGSLPFLVGKTSDGQTITKDLALLPHLLVAGTTGSGKTVFLYSLLVSLLYQFTPQQVSIVLIDPKQTDFVFFRDLAHLRNKQILNDPEEAIEQLRQLTGEELEARTALLKEARVVKLVDYNETHPTRPMIPIVVVVDEYADLIDVMQKVERKTFEREIRRLAARARNVGIHLVISTQRPSSDIVTSSLKTNLPARIAFRLPGHQDSIVILDQSGAENLLGQGDMLFLADGRLERLQGFYVSPTQLEEFLQSRKLVLRKRRKE
jgi:hypothetical protein